MHGVGKVCLSNHTVLKLSMMWACCVCRVKMAHLKQIVRNVQENCTKSTKTISVISVSSTDEQV